MSFRHKFGAKRTNKFPNLGRRWITISTTLSRAFSPALREKTAIPEKNDLFKNTASYGACLSQGSPPLRPTVPSTYSPVAILAGGNCRLRPPFKRIASLVFSEGPNSETSNAEIQTSFQWEAQAAVAPMHIRAGLRPPGSLCVSQMFCGLKRRSIWFLCWLPRSMSRRSSRICH